MDPEKSYTFLDHTADVYIAAYGKNLAEAFENAALAMFSIITDIEKVGAEIEEHLEVKAEDEQSLLYNWLEMLLVKFEIEGIFYSKFKISNITENKSVIGFSATIWGERINFEKHTQKTGVKAVTYHLMEIIKKPKMVTVKFILDV
jgi:SHS2 domain-containing protein